MLGTWEAPKWIRTASFRVPKAGAQNASDGFRDGGAIEPRRLLNGTAWGWGVEHLHVDMYIRGTYVHMGAWIRASICMYNAHATNRFQANARMTEANFIIIICSFHYD